ncbi:hypothetical protein ACFLZV_04820 [Candidatus Margulisiibacteriota bacterium]
MLLKIVSTNTLWALDDDEVDNNTRNWITHDGVSSCSSEEEDNSDTDNDLMSPSPGKDEEVYDLELSDNEEDEKIDIKNIRFINNGSISTYESQKKAEDKTTIFDNKIKPQTNLQGTKC